MKQWTIGIIGHGVRGRHCLEQYLMDYAPGSRVKKVAFFPESDPVMLEGSGVKEAKEYAEKFGAEYCDWEDIIADKEIDMVSVMIEPAKSAKVIEAALKAGKNVLCDKPHVKLLSEAERINGIRSEGALGVCFWMRYYPCAKYIFNKLKSGECGKVISAEVEALFGNGPLWGFTMTKEYMNAFGGGEMVNFGCYAVDILNCILGEPVEAHSVRTALLYDDYKETDSDDLSIMAIRYENGTVGNVITGRLREKLSKPALKIRVVTEKEVLYADTDTDYGIPFNPNEDLMVDYFAGIEKNDPSLYPNGFDGARVLKVLNMANELGGEKI